jgi:hypothetical protein
MSGLILGNANNNANVNANNTQYPGNFGSNQLPVNGSFKLSNQKGGSKKSKNNNITKYYNKMSSIKRKNISISRSRSRTLAGGIKKRSSSRYRRSNRRRSNSRRSNSKRQRGGNYAQYYNNYPNTPSYSVAGIPLSASNSALANPVPYVRLDNNVNGVDNYSKYTNGGFSSIGH